LGSSATPHDLIGFRRGDALVERVVHHHHRRRATTRQAFHKLHRKPAVGRGLNQSAFDRFALRFHHDALDSVVVGTEARDGREVLVIRSGPEGLIGRGGHRKRELHLAARHLVALADSFDQRRLSTELLTLQWRPSAFKLRWLPALLRDLGAAGWVLARLLAFHARCSLSGRPKRGLRTVEIPRPEPTATPTPSPAAASIQSSSRTRSSKALVN
jgi:hypothetical protein